MCPGRGGSRQRALTLDTGQHVAAAQFHGGSVLVIAVDGLLCAGHLQRMSFASKFISSKKGIVLR